MDKFVHLHVHSDFSVLDGHGKPKTYAQRAASLGQPALALTDHGSLSGAFTHWKECKDAGIKPIIGSELYIAPGRMDDKKPMAGFSGNGKYAHLTVLATGSEGLRNLYRLQARGYADGLYGKPRVDFDCLEQHSEGLIVLSGCAGSHISTYLRHNWESAAINLAERLKRAFPGRFFIETMYHGINEPDLDEALLNEQLLRLSRATGVPMVATNDAHYCGLDDEEAHDALLCIQTKALLSDENRFRFNGSGYHIRSRSDMEAMGFSQVALDNTLLVAEMIGDYDDAFAHRLRMPKYSDDEGYDLSFMAEEGLANRVAVTEEYENRLNYELSVINQMGYPGYFLVLHRIIREAKKRGITIGPGRGSAGGSLVAFALGITDLDPIAHGLLFERFLNPARKSLPDIDIDVNESQRPALLELIRELYGNDYVASIGTFGTIGAKAALKDANRVLGGTFARGSEYCSQLPPAKFGRSPGLDQYNGPKDEVFELASKLEGLVRNVGQHAAGVIISPESLTDAIPLWHPAAQESWVTGYDMKEVEKLGLVKMDFLGLRNLGVIDDCLRMLQTDADGTTGARRRLPTLPEECNDPATYELLSSGHTLGVFQLDSPGMRGLLRLLKPTCFDDISAVLALYRPGPMGANAHTEFAHRKNSNGGRWRSDWAIHPELEEALKPILESTYGLIVFQEQVLGALKAVCGWDYSEAALLFDAMRKKNHEKMEATKPQYIASAEKKVFSHSAISALWEVLVPFADYSFNRAHTAGYGLIAYWTAFLKANYPTEYMAALLSSVADDPNRLPEYLAEVERMGIRLLPPDINTSKEGFTPDGEVIRYGLAAIKGVGEKAFEAIARKRPYRNLGDFLHRCPQSALNAGVVSALAKCGALDSLDGRRESVAASIADFAELAIEARRAARQGQPTLVKPTYFVKPAPTDRKQRRQWEQETLGVSVSQTSVFVRPTRVLGEQDFAFLRKVMEASPGCSPLVLDFGAATLTVGSIGMTAKTRRSIWTLGGVEIVEE